MRRYVDFTSIVAAFVAVGYAVAICGNGIPALRHDWWWPTDNFGLIALFQNSTSGWIPLGFGSAYAYPCAYFLASIVAAVGLALGPFLALICFSLLLGSLCAFGARMLATELGGNKLQVSSAIIFAVVNPWVYSKTVAGHVYMICAYGGTLFFLASLASPKKDPRHAMRALIAITPQLQFLLIALALAAIEAVRRRQMLLLITGLALACPMIVGLWGDRQSLLSIPYLSVWQTFASVEPMKGILLSGYASGYDDRLGIFLNAMYVVAICAGIGAVIAKHRRNTSLIATLILLLILLASGTKGPLAAQYLQAVKAFPETAVFRELYDLLGYVAIGYLVLNSAQKPSTKLSRALHWCNLVAVSALALAWFFAPPYKMWVDARSLPRPTINAAANTRFALYPAFQPLSYHARGSGTDPDAYQRSNDVQPLNEYLTSYPENRAFSMYAKYGNSDFMRSLSVSEIVQRAWLTEQGNVFSGSNEGVLAHSRPSTRLDAEPELALAPPPLRVARDSYPSENAVFFSDAMGDASKLTPVTPDSTVNDPARGWIDARFVFIALPKLAQAFGGAYTTSAEELKVADGLGALIWVHGTLKDKRGAILSQSTKGYQWIAIPNNVHFVRCEGACLVAVQGPMPVGIPLDVKNAKVSPIPFRALTPWLIVAFLPPHTNALMRYNVRYDRGWLAIVDGKFALHQRIDLVANGWSIEPNSRQSRVIIIHTVAAVQCLMEIAAALLSIYLLLGLLLRRALKISS